jgi:glycosyltransferase involved in cell wall biosynthesis
MPGTKEGWPKVIAEAWAHGAVPLAARGGIVPWLLREPRSGGVFEPTPAGLASALEALFASPSEMEGGARSNLERAHGLSLSQFRSLVEGVLVERCGLR